MFGQSSRLTGADAHSLRCFLLADFVLFQHIQYLCPFYFFLAHELAHFKNIRRCF